jgi:peptide/nickel transport system substrate-binding protein
MTESDVKMMAARKAVGLGKLSRREFLQFATASGMTIAAANTLFARAARAEPKKGGTFRFASAFGTPRDVLDPATWSNGFTMQFGKSVMGAALAQLDPKNGLVPHVAETFEPVDGGKTWVIKIRKGITFHDGRSLTPDDVVASFRHHMAPHSRSPARSFLAAITAIGRDGPDTVKVELSGPNLDFPYLTTSCHLPILPAVDGAADWRSGIGAGPYVITSFVPGEKLIAERNPNYFKDSWFDAIEMLVIPEIAARTNAFMSGEVHFMDRVDLRTIDMLTSAPDTEIYNQQGPTPATAPMLCDTAPFTDLNVRLALKHAFDRQQLVDRALRGYARPGNDNLLERSQRYATNPEPVFGYDPEKARSYLKQAGLESLKLDLSLPSIAPFPNAAVTAQLMQEQARKAGIEINIVPHARRDYQKPWSLSSWNAVPTIDMLFTMALGPDSTVNDTRWQNPRFQELLVAARGEADEAKRQAMYAEMQQLLHDEGGQLVLMFTNFVGALNTAVAHGDLNSDLDCDGGYMVERWWMA